MSRVAGTMMTLGGVQIVAGLSYFAIHKGLPSADDSLGRRAGLVICAFGVGMLLLGLLLLGLTAL